jgi:putative MFS transporter
MDTSASVNARDELHIAARIERLPYSPWHVRMRIILGVATFFDAFDALTIAYIVPSLLGEWHFSPAQIGPLFSIGYAGQAIGALAFGWLAERFGRVRMAMFTVLIFAVMSIFCANAQNYEQLFWYRFVQGIGLGGEVPLAAAYINEIAKAKGRGRFFLYYEAVFPAGLLAVALIAAWVVPTFGWRWMFYIGAVPALIVIGMRQWCPESPRWLASRGRKADAEASMAEIEAAVSGYGARPLPPVPDLPLQPPPIDRPGIGELFRGMYLQRTIVVSLLWIAAYMVTYGLIVWLPTIYRTVYGLSVQDSINYSLLQQVMSMIAFLIAASVIDATGRKKMFAFCFIVGALPLFLLWYLKGGTADSVRYLAAVSMLFVSVCSGALYLYVPELYPTRIRALGTAWSTFWLRIASIAGPLIVGWILPVGGTAGVFLFVGIVSLLGGIVCLLFAEETSGKVLEEISP